MSARAFFSAGVGFFAFALPVYMGLAAVLRGIWSMAFGG